MSNHGDRFVRLFVEDLGLDEPAWPDDTGADRGRGGDGAAANSGGSA
jgi:hypothetical protein